MDKPIKLGRQITSFWQKIASPKVAPYIFIAPFILYFLVFFLYPICETFYTSLRQQVGFAPPQFAGLANYKLLNNEYFITSVENSAMYTFFTCLILVPLPLLEDIYNFEDALLVGSMLMTFLRNADRVKIACLAQLVNVIAPIMTRNGGGCWAQTIFYPFMHASVYGRGTALRAVVDSPVYDCKDFEKVPLIDAMATQADDGSVTVFCVNRDMVSDFALDVCLKDFGKLRIAEHILLHHDDVKAVNSEENPDNVTPTADPGGVIDGGNATIKIPALSWNVIRFEKQD